MPFFASLEGVFGYGRFITANQFSPADILGMALWMDATKLTGFSCNAGITNWSDASPYGFIGYGTGNPTYITNSINSNPVVRFNGTSQFFNFSNVLNMETNPIYMFAVFKYNSTTSPNALIGKTSARSSPARYAFVRDAGNNTFIIQTDGATAANIFYADTSTVPQLMEGTWNRSVSAIYKNGGLCNTASIANATSLTTTDPLVLGAYPSSTGSVTPPLAYMNGDVGEILIYNKFISPYQRQQIEGYLTWKWGLQSNLPLNHPFRSNAPTSSPSAFQPTMLSNLQGWFDGSDPLGTGSIPANGDSVTTWFDKSGYGRNATGGTAGFYSNVDGGMIRFNGSSTYYPITTLATTLVNQYFTIFVVERLQATASISRVFVAGNNTTTNGNLHILYDAVTPAATTMKMGYFGNDLSVSSGIPAFTTAANQPIRVWSFSQRITSRSIYLNGSNLGNNANNTLLSSWAGATIGRYQTTAFYMGNYHELLFYTGSLAYYDQQEIEGYLAWKWGIQTSLPSWHPFRSSAPTTATVPFQPTMVPNLQGWYDGSDPLATGSPPANGASVSTWFDKSFSGRDMVATTAGNYSNLNGGFINFNGTSTRYTIPANLVTSFINQYHSIFVVERLQQPNSVFTGILGGSANVTRSNLSLLYINSNANAMRYGLFANEIQVNNIPAFTTAANQPTRIWSFTQRVSSRNAYLNGSNGASDTNNLLLLSWANAQVGYYQQQNVYYRGQIYDLLFYNGVVSFFDQQRIEGYLAWKWGLQSNLLLYHPFRNTPPTSASISILPNMFMGLAIWLDASDTSSFSLSGSNITQWRDKSGNGNHFSVVQGAPTRIVDNSITVVDISGTGASSAILGGTISLSVTTNFWFFAVVKVTGLPNITPAIGTFLGIPDANKSIRYYSVTGPLSDVQLRGGPNQASDSNDIIAAPQVNGSRDATPSSVYTNYHMFDGPSQLTISGIPRISDSALGGRYFYGRVCEVLIYNMAISTANRQIIQGYLAWKWGLQSNLPAGHPYKNTAPTSANL